MKKVSKRFEKGIILEQEEASTTAIENEGELRATTDGKIQAQIDSDKREIITDTQTQTLTNKTLTSPVIDSGDINTPDIDGGTIDTSTITNATINNPTVGTSAQGNVVTTDGDAQTITTEKRFDNIKLNSSTQLTATSAELNQISGITVGGTDSGDVVTTDGTQTLTNKTVTIPSATNDRVLETDSSGNITESNVTSTELDNLSGTTSNIQTQLDAKIDDSEKGAVNGVATLDAGGKIPVTQVPNIAVTDVSVVADITARDALTVEEGDVAFVTDASADPSIGSGSAQYIYDGTTWQLFTADQGLELHKTATSGVHGVTGNVVGDTDSQTLTNKTLSSSNISGGFVNLSNSASTFTLPRGDQSTLDSKSHNIGDLAFNTDLNVPVFASTTGTGEWNPIGSGSGAGGINLLPVFDFEDQNIDDLSEIDVGSANPADGSLTATIGSGQSPSITTTVNTSSTFVLFGSNTLLISAASGSGREGQGITIPVNESSGFLNMETTRWVFEANSADFDLEFWSVGYYAPGIGIFFNPIVTKNTNGVLSCEFEIPTAQRGGNDVIVIYLRDTGTAVRTLALDTVRFGPKTFDKKNDAGDLNLLSVFDFENNDTSKIREIDLGSATPAFNIGTLTLNPQGTSNELDTPQIVDLDFGGGESGLSLQFTGSATGTGEGYAIPLETPGLLDSTSFVFESFIAGSTGDISNFGFGVYDRTNGLFYDADYFLNNGKIKFKINFDISTSTEAYVVFYNKVAEVGSRAFNNMKFTPETAFLAPTIIEDFGTDYSSNIDFFEDNVGIINSVDKVNANGRRVGNMLEVTGRYRGTANNTSTNALHISILNGLTLDGSNMINGNNVGVFSIDGAPDFIGTITFNSIVNRLQFIHDANETALNTLNVGEFDLNRLVQFKFQIPIVEWKTSQSFISTTETINAPVRVRVTETNGQSIPTSSSTTILYNNTTYDTHNAYNSSTGQFTAPKSAYYRVEMAVRFSGITTTDDIIAGETLCAGVLKAEGRRITLNNDQYSVRCTDVIFVEAGQTIESRVFQGSGSSATLETSAIFNVMTITEDVNLTQFGIFGPTEDPLVVQPLSNQVINIHNTWTDLTGFTATLTPGRYIGVYSIPVTFSFASSTDEVFRFNIAMTDASNNIVPGSQSYKFRQSINLGITSFTRDVSRTFIIEVTETQVYKLRSRIGFNTGSGTTSATILNNPNNTGLIDNPDLDSGLTIIKIQ